MKLWLCPVVLFWRRNECVRIDIQIYAYMHIYICSTYNAGCIMHWLQQKKWYAQSIILRKKKSKKICVWNMCINMCVKKCAKKKRCCIFRGSRQGKNKKYQTSNLKNMCKDRYTKICLYAHIYMHIWCIDCSKKKSDMHKVTFWKIKKYVCKYVCAKKKVLHFQG